MNSPPTPAITKRNQESGPTAFAISLNPDNSGMSGLGTQRRTYLEYLKPEAWLIFSLLSDSLGGEIPGFRFYRPGSIHIARFMAKGIYLAMLAMLQHPRTKKM